MIHLTPSPDSIALLQDICDAAEEQCQISQETANWRIAHRSFTAAAKTLILLYGERLNSFQKTNQSTNNIT